MSENNQENLEENQTPPEDVNEQPTADENDPVKKAVKEAVKDVKTKLDSAYKQRDEAFKKLAELEQKRKEDEIKRLQEEGKHKEALEIQLAEERAKREALEKRTVELSRDIRVRGLLSSLPFRNDKAQEVAYNDIVRELVQDEDSNWVHRSGMSIDDYIKAYEKDDSNSFLFKVKGNSGGGSSTTRTGGATTRESNSIFEKSQDEVLKLAAEGKLPNQRK